jgi:hypothetical protein
MEQELAVGVCSGATDASVVQSIDAAPSVRRSSARHVSLLLEIQWSSTGTLDASVVKSFSVSHATRCYVERFVVAEITPNTFVGATTDASPRLTQHASETPSVLHRRTLT